MMQIICNCCVTSKINIKDLFQTVDAVHSHKTRAATNNELHTVHTNLGITQRSTSCSAVHIWNDLAKNIRDVQSIAVFKKRWKEHLCSEQKSLI